MRLLSYLAGALLVVLVVGDAVGTLVVTRGFWGHSAEDTVLQEVKQSTLEAYARARGRRTSR